MPLADASQLKAALQQWSFGVLGTAVDLMVEPMRPYAPIGKSDTAGELRESITVDRAAGFGRGSDVYAARIIAPVIQAKTTDQGAPAHQIAAKKPHGLLVFDVNGQTVFSATPVNHPGNTARPWWRRALDATFGPNLRYAAQRTPFR